jgi:hypothetical protein
MYIDLSHGILMTASRTTVSSYSRAIEAVRASVSCAVCHPCGLHPHLRRTTETVKRANEDAHSSATLHLAFALL